MKLINTSIRLVQLALLGFIANILLWIMGTLGDMTFEVECHPDEQINRMVCYIAPITDLIRRPSAQRGDNA